MSQLSIVSCLAMLGTVCVPVSAMADSVYIDDLLEYGFEVKSSNVVGMAKDRIEVFYTLQNGQSVFLCKADVDVKRGLSLDPTGPITELTSADTTHFRACAQISKKGL